MLTIQILKQKIEVIFANSHQKRFSDFVMDSLYEPHFSNKDILARLNSYLDSAIVGDEIDEAIENNLDEFFKLYKL